MKFQIMFIYHPSICSLDLPLLLPYPLSSSPPAGTPLHATTFPSYVSSISFLFFPLRIQNFSLPHPSLKVPHTSSNSPPSMFLPFHLVPIPSFPSISHSVSPSHTPTTIHISPPLPSLYTPSTAINQIAQSIAEKNPTG